MISRDLLPIDSFLLVIVQLFHLISPLIVMYESDSSSAEAGL
jgi:hypothetical protein